MLLWELKENLPAHAFYEALAGQLLEGHEQRAEIGGDALTEVAYGWPGTIILPLR